MHYALNLRTFFYSHYFYLGLRVAIGVLGLTMLTLWYGTPTAAMMVCIGALCTSLMDMPSPLRHKLNEMGAAVVLCSAMALIIGLSSAIEWLMITMLVVMSFFAGMMVVYGKKAMPLQFSLLLIMTLSMEQILTPWQALQHAATLLCGALLYLLYAMTIAWFLRHRIKQQVVAEALFELAHYVRIKSDCYDARYNLSDQFNLLVRHQALLGDRYQAVRDLLLRGQRERKDAILIQIHVSMLDLYELILSTHTDYVLLRQHLADSDILHTLRDLTAKAARDIASVGYAVTRNQASYATFSYELELRAIDAELHALRQRADAGEPTQEMQTVLRAQGIKVQAMLNMIGQLHRASQATQDLASQWEGADMTPFLSHQPYELGMMRAHLHFDSPVLRFALRFSLAILAGLLIGPYLPYAAHSYWIVLTIIIILKPSFSVTRQRRRDRLTGTVIGCVLAAAVLYFTHWPVLIFFVLFLSMVAAPTFIYLRYQYTVIAASLMILLQMNLMAPNSLHVISERLVDTFIGAAIASVFSFVLASWEYHALPRLSQMVLEANRRYMRASFELLRGNAKNDLDYRIERKRLLDNLGALSAALVRMLDEPASKQRAVEEINLFILQNYLLVAHMAALRLLLLRHQEAYPAQAVNQTLAHSEAALEYTLALALQTASAPPEAVNLSLAPDEAAWSGWSLLHRRIRLLQADADKVGAHSAVIMGPVS